MMHTFLPFIGLFIITHTFSIESPFTTSSLFEKNINILTTGTKESFIDKEDSLIFNQVFSPEEMQEDIEYFFDKLEEVHVNPYAFFSKDSIEQRKDELLKSLDKPMKRYEFNRKASSINSLFDGHTRIVQYDAHYYNFYQKENGRFIPYLLKYAPGKLRFNTKLDTLKTLDIKAINKITVDSISSEIEKRVNLENASFRNYYIEKYLHVYLYTIFDIQSPYVLDVVDTLKKESYKLKFDGVTSDKIWQPTELNNQPYSTRIYPEDSIAIIEHNTCAFKPNSHEMKKFHNYLDSSFQVINKLGVQHLFIDVSRNGGGASNANNVFYQNIKHNPYPWKKISARKVSMESKLLITGFSLYHENTPLTERLEKYHKKVESGDLTRFQRSFINLKNGDLSTHTYSRSTTSNSNGYNNNIYLIQSYRTYSAAMELSAWFKYGKVGTIIGSETGGTTEVYIDAILFTMPNSKIGFQIADQYVKYPNGSLDKGILPDIDLGPGFYKEKYELEDLKGFLKMISK